MLRARVLLLGASLLVACSQGADYDLIIRGGGICDGSGDATFVADLAIDGDSIAAMGDLREFHGRSEIEAGGLAVSPGFINMLSWATESLIEDGRSQSDIRQGVTLEVFGEGSSMGPMNDRMKQEELEQQGDIKYDIEWNTLGEYLEYLVQRGVSTNVASFMGATTARIYSIGYEDRAPTPDELDEMRGLVRHAMEEGALGLGSSLIYAPAFYSETDELIALARVAAEYDGMYISHMRNESNSLLEALEEFFAIAREAGIRSEIYHLKTSGKANWHKLETVFARVEEARAEGLEITADMYTYPASSTGLDAAMPPWVQEGGYKSWAERLKDPAIRERVQREMNTPSDDWANGYLAAGSPENILLVSFKNDELKPLTGKTLAEVAVVRGTSPEETAMDLVIEDGSRVGCVYFTMSEENVQKKIAQPWVSFGSDAGSLATEGVFLKSNPHPRAYGTFARVLGKYVRDEGVISLEEAVRKMTSLPASNLRIRRRGLLAPGYFADIVIFDPDEVADHATFDEPHQYSTGVIHVFVNGVQVLQNGEHTGATPGRVVRGPGWSGWRD
ncbi:MAG: aminoacylase [Gemmatimonas sp. SG8_38_2]|nr:MAG: aminoacylase [Gemmatimonas sp. SG8_38_2]